MFYRQLAESGLTHEDNVWEMKYAYLLITSNMYVAYFPSTIDGVVYLALE